MHRHGLGALAADADDLAVIVDRVGLGSAALPAQVAEVGRLPVLPEEGDAGVVTAAADSAS